ncbi:MAG: ArsR family transcriptional regulator [Candidatus Heimdallarchaeota archaeon]|nr:ArsR family transcriptional regulator [Candidatus Heimdallarchaeota archaeon]
MKTIHELLSDKLSADVLAQVTRHGGEISAKEIASNIKVPLTTVYYYLNALEEDGFIVSDEVRVRNLNKKVWRRSEIAIEDPETSRIINKNYNQSVSKEPLTFSSFIRFFNAFIQEDLVSLETLDKEKFSNFQQNSQTPFLIKLYGMNKEDYIFTLNKLMELRKELWSRAKERGENQEGYQSTNFEKEEQFLLFLVAIPKLDEM